MPSDPAPDQRELAQLIEAAVAGDADAMTRVLATHHPRLLGLARRKVGVDWQGKIDPEDVLQDTYIEIAAHITQFVPDGEDAFFRWGAKVLDSKFIDQVRSHRRQKRDATREVMGGANPSRYDALVGMGMPRGATASRAMRKQDAIGAAMGCVAALKPEHRELVVRVHLRGERIGQVAVEMGKSEDAARRMLGRALDELAADLGRVSRYLSETP